MPTGLCPFLTSSRPVSLRTTFHVLRASTPKVLTMMFENVWSCSMLKENPRFVIYTILAALPDISYSGVKRDILAAQIYSEKKCVLLCRAVFPSWSCINWLQIFHWVLTPQREATDQTFSITRHVAQELEKCFDFSAPFEASSEY